MPWYLSLNGRKCEQTGILHKPLLSFAFKILFILGKKGENNLFLEAWNHSLIIHFAPLNNSCK